MPEISVIVPVYNVEKYLSQCLESIINQTFSDIEIICVNDGSTDNSRQILEEYKLKDSRIIIEDKANGGLSSARNTGLKAAKGRVISFVDSDDWIAPDMLEKLYNDMVFYNTDISICAVHLYDEISKTVDDDDGYYNLSKFNRTFDNRAFSYRDTKPFLTDICVMAWNKLYRKSLIDKVNAKFPDGLIFEDGPFFYDLFFNTDRVSVVRDFLYYYRINRKGSIVQNGGENLFDIIDIVNLMCDKAKNTSVWNDIKYDFFKRKADDIIYRFNLIEDNLKPRFSKLLKEKSCLSDENIFDFAFINSNMPVTYKCLCDIKYKTSRLNYLKRKIERRFINKIIQILETEKDCYYFKFWSLKFKIKKIPRILDVNYKNDRIYIIFLDIIKLSIKFEYSKLERN